MVRESKARTLIIFLIQIILVLIIIFIAGTVFYFNYIHKFLSVNHPVKADVLVIEGWVPDFALQIGLDDFRHDHYKLLITSGGPLSRHSYLSEYRTEAEISQASLRAMGLGRDSLHAVPGPFVYTERTYNSALAVKQFLIQNRIKPKSFNVLTVGPHARRTLLLYHKAFGKDWNIGIINAVWPGYEGKFWYNSSEGFRMMVDETVAWFYAEFFFHPKPQ